MKSCLALILIAFSPWALASPTVEVEAFLPTTTDLSHYCISYFSQLKTLKDNKESLETIREIYEEAVETDNQEDIDQYGPMLEEYQDIVAMNEDHLKAHTRELTGYFMATLSEGVVFPTERLNPPHGQWELRCLSQNDRGQSYLPKGGFRGRIIGAMVCDYMEKAKNNLETALKLALEDLLRP